MTFDSRWNVPTRRQARQTEICLLAFCPGTRFAIFVDLEMDNVGRATDRAVFHVVLLRTGGCVDRNHDLLATRIANVLRLKRYRPRLTIFPPAILLSHTSLCDASASGVKLRLRCRLQLGQGSGDFRLFKLEDRLIYVDRGAFFWNLKLKRPEHSVGHRAAIKRLRPVVVKV